MNIWVHMQYLTALYKCGLLEIFLMVSPTQQRKSLYLNYSLPWILRKQESRIPQNLRDRSTVLMRQQLSFSEILRILQLFLCFFTWYFGSRCRQTSRRRLSFSELHPVHFFGTQIHIHWTFTLSPERKRALDESPSPQPPHC